jgi:hypothetical protein
MSRFTPARGAAASPGLPTHRATVHTCIPLPWVAPIPASARPLAPSSLTAQRRAAAASLAADGCTTLGRSVRGLAECSASPSAWAYAGMGDSEGAESRVQMWEECAESRCRCGGVSPVPAQMWRGEPSPGADVAG